MTWNELIDRLQSIPEERREEQAVFFDEQDGIGHIIDEMEKRSMDEGSFDCTVGDEAMETTFVLIP